MADLRSVVWSSLTYSEYYNSIIYYSTNVWLTDFTLFSITKSTSTKQSSKFMTGNKTIERKYIVSHALIIMIVLVALKQFTKIANIKWH